MFDMAKVNYSKELQEELVKMYEKDCLSLKEIAKIKHISPAKVKELLINNNVEVVAFKSPIRTDEQKSQIIDLYVNQHMGCDKIGRLLNIPSKRINAFLHDQGLINGVGKTKKHSCNSFYFQEIDTEDKAY